MAMIVERTVERSGGGSGGGHELASRGRSIQDHVALCSNRRQRKVRNVTCFRHAVVHQCDYEQCLVTQFSARELNIKKRKGSEIRRGRGIEGG